MKVVAHNECPTSSSSCAGGDAALEGAKEDWEGTRRGGMMREVSTSGAAITLVRFL